jgi:hypothetical protein
MRSLSPYSGRICGQVLGAQEFAKAASRSKPLNSLAINNLTKMFLFLRSEYAAAKFKNWG